MVFLAWRNVVRRLGQSVTTALVIAVATCVVTASAIVAGSLDRGVSMSRERLGADVMVLPAGASTSTREVLFTAQPVNVYLDESVVGEVRRLPGVAAATPQFFTQTVNQSCCSVVGVTRIVGIDPESDFVVAPWRLDGPGVLEGDGILVGAAAPSIDGGQASILGEVFRVAGTLAQTGTSVDETIFMDMASARRIASASPYLETVWQGRDPFASVSCVMVRVGEGADASRVARDVMDACPGTVAVVASDVVAGVSSQLGAVKGIFAWFLAALVALAALALVGRFSALVSSRMAEWALLRTMGVGTGGVVSAVLWEVAIVALAGAAAGLLGGCLAARAACGVLHGAFPMPGTLPDPGYYAGACAVGLVFALALSGLAAAWPVAGVARRDIQETLARGDVR